jgi:hypothetical protein
MALSYEMSAKNVARHKELERMKNRNLTIHIPSRDVDFDACSCMRELRFSSNV